MTRATLLAQLDTFPNILTLLLPSKLNFQCKELLQQYCGDRDVDFCVLANHQYGKKYGMQQAAVVEEIMKKKVAERGEEPAGSMHQHTGSGRSSFNHQWKHHLNEIRSQARLLEVFGALVGYIAENGVYVSTEEDDEEFDNLPETFHTAQDALSGTTVHTPHINTSACIDDKVIGLQSIRSVLCINSQHLMHMDRATFDSLSIFKVEQHPCLTMKIGAPKESLSLFNILDHTCTSMGKDLLKDWMRKPTTNLDELKMRHEAIKYFVSGDALELHNDIVQYLKSIKDLKRIVHRMHVGKSTVRDWHNLQRSLQGFQKVYTLMLGRDAEENATQHLPKLFQIHVAAQSQQASEQPSAHDSPQHLSGNTNEQAPAQSQIDAALREMNDDITECIELLSRTIDWNQSKEQRRLVIKLQVDDELDELKDIYDSLDILLNRVAQQEIMRLPSQFTTIACAYFPQIGFLIQVPRTNPQEMDAYAHELHPSLEYRFKTDESYYYKNRSMVELDTSIGDIHGCIMDKEEEVVREIEMFLLEYEGIFDAITEIIARVDCVLSLALVAREHELVCPKMHDDRSILNIRGGRNILLEQSVQQLIPNDVYCNEHSRRLHIITGANGSGKSVYLRQVGLIVYMAHIGCYLPCGEAHIGVVDRIMTRIQSQDSVLSGQSSFSSDLQQINLMLQSYTRDSLLLLDEFGKGTLALDGISLMGAVLNHFVSEERQRDCPRMFVTTHYTELFDHEIIPMENILVQMMKTQVTIPGGDQCTNETVDPDETKDQRIDDRLIYLYKIVPCAIPDSSYGIACAQSVGIPVEILERAKEILPKLQHGEFIAPLDVHHRLKCEAECVEIIQRFLNVDFENDHEVELFVGCMKASMVMMVDEEEQEEERDDIVQGASDGDEEAPVVKESTAAQDMMDTTGEDE